MERVVLAGLIFYKKQKEEFYDSMEELESLSKTLNCEVVEKIIQKREKPCPATYIGKGKAEEIAKLVKEKNIKAVIFDTDLTPSQVKNLENILGSKVIDRTWLILSIFAEKARTEEAKIQVSLAQYEYLLPRLTKQWSHLSRQWGGIGTKGVGEKQLEIDKRLIKDRINNLKKQLKKIESRRDVLLKSHENFPRVALVGYTNAGKSTLFNYLTNSNVKVSNLLFSTLDPKISKIRDCSIPVLISDTVGFIRNIPHHLIASFKSTLKEAIYADLVLHIVDRSRVNFEVQERVGNEIIEFLKIPKEKVLTVYNKADLIFEKEEIPFPYISAKLGWGIENLIKEIERRILSSFTLIKKSFQVSKKELKKIVNTNLIYSIKRNGKETEVTFWVRKNS